MNFGIRRPRRHREDPHWAALLRRQERQHQLRQLIQNHQGSHQQLADDIYRLVEGWGR